MKNNFKNKVVKALREEGFSIQQQKMSAAYLKRYEFEVNTIIDVGVCGGTPFFYESFPEANIILIDPLDDAKNVYHSLEKNRKVELFECIANDSDGEASFHITNVRSMSSVQQRTSLTSTDIAVDKIVRTLTLDTVCQDTNFSAPFGIKIDTEGHELQVLKGISTCLPNIAFFIIEVSIRDRFIEGYRFSTLIQLMYKIGFELIDILSNQIMPRYVDCLFVKTDSAYFTKC